MFSIAFSSRFKLLKVPPGARQTAQAWFQHGRTPFFFGRILIQLEWFHNGVWMDTFGGGIPKIIKSVNCVELYIMFQFHLGLLDTGELTAVAPIAW